MNTCDNSSKMSDGNKPFQETHLKKRDSISNIDTKNGQLTTKTKKKMHRRYFLLKHVEGHMLEVHYKKAPQIQNNKPVRISNY